MTAVGRPKAWLRYTRLPKAEVGVALPEAGEKEALPAAEVALVLETVAESSRAAVKVALSAEPPQQEAAV